MTDTNIGIQRLFVLDGAGISQGFGQVVIDLFDPTGGLPANPSDGDTYVSTATANGWELNAIEYWDVEAGWKAIAPVSGAIIYVNAINASRVYDPVANAWQPISDFIGAVTGPGSSTNNALARWDGEGGTALANSPVVVDDAGNMTGVNTFTATGAATVGSLTTAGVNVTPSPANPGGANTIWADSGNGNRPTYGAEPLARVAGAPADNALVRFDGTTGTIQPSAATLDDAGNLTGIGDLTMSGKLTVAGTIDPTGLELTPVTTNPGGANMIWLDSNNSNRMTYGAAPVPVVSGTPADNQLVRFDGTTGTIQPSDATISDDGTMVTYELGVNNEAGISNLLCGPAFFSGAVDCWEGLASTMITTPVLSANSATAGSLTVSTEATLPNTTVNGNLSATGALTAQVVDYKWSTAVTATKIADQVVSDTGATYVNVTDWSVSMGDESGLFNPGGYFTAADAGYYYVCFAAIFISSGFTGDEIVAVALRRASDPSVRYQAHSRASMTYFQLVSTGLMYLSVGDMVRPVVSRDDNTAAQIWVGGTYTVFRIAG